MNINEFEINKPAKTKKAIEDLIVYVDGLPVVSVNSLLELMQKYRPQERIQLEIRRGDKLQTISIQVESPPKALPSKGAETKGN